MSQSLTTLEPLALPIPGAQRFSGLSRSAIYKLLGDGSLVASKAGGRTLILTASLRAYIDSLPKAAFKPSKAA